MKLGRVPEPPAPTFRPVSMHCFFLAKSLKSFPTPKSFMTILILCLPSVRIIPRVDHEAHFPFRNGAGRGRFQEAETSSSMGARGPCLSSPEPHFEVPFCLSVALLPFHIFLSDSHFLMRHPLRTVRLRWPSGLRDTPNNLVADFRPEDRSVRLGLAAFQTCITEATACSVLEAALVQGLRAPSPRQHQQQQIRCSSIYNTAASIQVHG